MRSFGGDTIRQRFSSLILSLAFLSLSCGGDRDSSLNSGIGAGEDRLLSDQELHTVADPNAPDENAAWVDWIENNHLPIRSLTSKYMQDLQFFKPLLEGKRLVQLGENSHGVSEYSQVKVRLVKFLHEELDYDVIAFESGLFECFNGNRRKGELAPLELMTSSINGMWHTTEVLELFEYIAEIAETDDPLILAGFDVLMPVSSDISGRPDLFYDIISQIDPVYAQAVYDLDSNFIHMRDDYSEFKAFVGANRNELLASYRAVVTFFDDHAAGFAAAFPDDPTHPLFARQMASSITYYIDRAYYAFTGDILNQSAIRDLGMAENAEFFLDEMYPDKKIITWAHNFHISNDSEQIEGASFDPFVSVGSHLAENRRDEMYTIGFYMYRGQAAFFHVQIYDITEATSGSLESIFYHTRRKYSFVDMLYRERDEGNFWMFREITAKDWGTMPHTMILRDQYDGILFIDTVTPIEYISY